MSKIDNLTFEQAFAELEDNVRKLEAGGLTIEEGMALFERGQALAARCNQQLDEAELKIKQITPEGEVALD
jgi:exodeoxyribonuclease VII small subunit